MTSPSSVRFDPAVNERLSSYVRRHAGWTRSSAAARLVDEGLRMDEHPAVIFRDGPAGRRATLIGGPDVWEVMRAVKSWRRWKPDLTRAELVQHVEDTSGVPRRLVLAALDYWAAYPDEIDDLVADAERLEDEAEQASARTTDLLGP